MITIPAKNGASSSQTGQGVDAQELEKMAKSVCKVTFPTSDSMQVDSTLSEYDGNAMGAQIGGNTYAWITNKNFLAVDAGSSPVALVAGKDVVFDGVDTFKKESDGAGWTAWFQSIDPVIDPSIENAAILWPIEDDHDNDGSDGDDGAIREMGALDNNPSENDSFTKTERALYQVNATTAYVYEDGANKGAFPVKMSVGDFLGMVIRYGVVSYAHYDANGLETIFYTSPKPANEPYFFKGILNRGANLSGASVMGGVRVHKTMITSQVAIKISGSSDELIRDEDTLKLESIGLKVRNGSKYSLLMLDRKYDAGFPSPADYRIVHGYYVTTTQSVIQTQGDTVNAN